MSSINISSTPLTTPSTSEFFCSICKKNFRKQIGLSRHLAIVKKYNIPRDGLDSLTETNNKKFKNILVYLIHRKLPRWFKKGGRQLVSLACTEHQFVDIFKGHIHYRRNKNVYKWAFRGTNGYKALSKILDNQLWGRKFYDKEQQTYVILFDNPPQHLKNNPLAIAARCAAESNITKRRKSNIILEKLTLNGKLK